MARQLVDADGDTSVRLRTVRNAAPPSATRAIADPAPTRALGQSNPSPVDGELEATAGSPAGGGTVAFSDEYPGFPGSTRCALARPLGAPDPVDPCVIAFTDDWPEPSAGWLDCSDPPVIALGDEYALALAGIASAQTARTSTIARRLMRRLRRDMMVMV
jgi:hypothetical protein